MLFKSLPLLLILGLAACDTPGQPESTHPDAQPPAAVQPQAVANTWLGRWTGPEGTYLDVSRVEENYQVAIRDLDTERTFDAVSIDGGLSFYRNGIQETIKPGTGKDTGMKWLQDKTICLVVKLGEGYCRQ